jgi:hypothetical protein
MENKKLSELDLENKQLIEDIIKSFNLVMNAELLHYRSYSCEQALERQQKFIKIKTELTNRYEEIFDL